MLHFLQILVVLQILNEMQRCLAPSSQHRYPHVVIGKNPLSIKKTERLSLIHSTYVSITHYKQDIRLMNFEIIRKSEFASCMKVKVAQSCPTPWTIQSMEFSRPEYWSGLPSPSPGDLLTQRLNPGLLHCRRMLYCLSYYRNPKSWLWICK